MAWSDFPDAKRQRCVCGLGVLGWEWGLEMGGEVGGWGLGIGVWTWIWGLEVFREGGEREEVRGLGRGRRRGRGGEMEKRGGKGRFVGALRRKEGVKGGWGGIFAAGDAT